MKLVVNCLLIFSIILAVALTAWADSVQGVVVLHDETPVSYRRVYIGDNRALTDDHGNFVMWLDPGEYDIRVQGFNNCEPPIVEVRSGERTELVIHVSR